MTNKIKILLLAIFLTWPNVGCLSVCQNVGTVPLPSMHLSVNIAARDDFIQPVWRSVCIEVSKSQHTDDDGFAQQRLQSVAPVFPR